MSFINTDWIDERPLEEVLFPKHKCGLYLTHNQHKDLYETVKHNIESKHPAYEENYFVSKEDMQKCIDTDECWELQWYPETPNGFHKICGSTLKIVLEKGLEYK